MFVISSTEDSTLSFRTPRISDAAAIHRMVADSGILDENSIYAYLLLCRDFAETCVVVESGEELAGFVTAYTPPPKPDVLFVWQVAVSPNHRRKGLGKRMLLHLAERSKADGLKWIEATVAPSNTASRRLFQSLSEELNTGFQEVTGFVTEDFGGDEHEEEPLLQIGPFQVSRV